MRSGRAQHEYRQYRAPRGDRSALIEPPLDRVRGVATANRRLHEDWAGYDCQGRSLGRLAAEARQHLLDEAVRWTSAYRDMSKPKPGADGTIYLAGHQPQLFHPGVWLKNFALGRLARDHGGTAVNLLVDNDAARSASVRVPGGTAERPFWTEVPLDRALRPMPYEDRPVADRELFASFGPRAAEQIAPLVPGPLVRDFWPVAVERMRATGLLGASLAQARHVLEGRWGLETLEAPLGRVCDGAPFFWFVAHLLAHLPRLRELYNEAVGEYRRAHRIRNAAHPVPDLAADGPWLEAPLWIWTKDDPQRRGLFARQDGDEIEITDRAAIRFRLPLAPDGEGGRAVERFLDLSREGVKLRPRALMTTLWARVVLGDLFIHGIGGAKYDQVTDCLVERFFGFTPPGVMVVSATLHLPVAHPRATVEDLRGLRRQLRDLAWHPERHLDLEGAPPSASCPCQSPAYLAAEKSRWIAAFPNEVGARERFLEIRRLNEALRRWVAPERERLLQQQTQAVEALRAERVLGWREYAFCLYPEGLLREFFAGHFAPDSSQRARDQTV